MRKARSSLCLPRAGRDTPACGRLASDFICLADGAISQLGAIDDLHIVQAKRHVYATTELVGGNARLAAQFQHGSFANLYLSPKGCAGGQSGYSVEVQWRFAAVG